MTLFLIIVHFVTIVIKCRSDILLESLPFGIISLFYRFRIDVASISVDSSVNSAEATFLAIFL